MSDERGAPPDEAAVRESWLEERRGIIGASEASALFDAHRFLSPFALYCKKRRLVPDDVEESEAAAWGARLEPVIADWYAETTGRTLIDHGRTVFRRHPSAPLGATLDREIVAFDDRGSGALEIKTADMMLAHDWKEGPPLGYAIQLQAQLAVTGWTWGEIVVSLGRCSPLRFEQARNENFIATLLDECRAFWRRVQNADPPPPDAHPATGRALKALYPGETGEVIDLPPDAATWDAERLRLLDEKKRIEKVLDGLDNQLRAVMGAASIGRLPGGGSYALHVVKGGPVSYMRADYRALRRTKK